MIQEDNKTYFDTNKARWNDRVNVHLKSELYNMEAFMAGATSLKEIEINGLPDVKGKSLLHLMCHFGQDTLSLTRMGAKATGIDLSDKAIDTARELNDKLGLDATFHTCNLYDIEQQVEGQFDIVFTSYGALCWLPDLKEWARLVAKYLKPGGIFYIAEFHPTFHMFDFDSQKATYNYFFNPIPEKEIGTGTYADRDADLAYEEYFWQHDMEDIIQPLLNEGLQLQEIKEFPFSPYDCFPDMKQVGESRYVFGDYPFPLPHVFSLKMRKTP